MVLVAVVVMVQSASWGYKKCFADASDELQVFLGTKGVTFESICVNGEEIIVNINSCVAKVGRFNPIAPLLYERSIEGLKGGLSERVESHNKVCPNNQVENIFD